MKRFRNILVYVNGADGGLGALRHAAKLAERDSASVTVVDVLPELPASMKSLQEIMPVAEVESIAQQEVRARLDELIRTVALEAQAKVLIGKPFLEIIRQVLIERYDLVIKTAEHAHGLSSRIFGSTGQHLLRKCPCPVWIVKPDSPPHSDCILAAVDISATDDSEQRLNHDIVETAAGLADYDKTQLHVVTSAALWVDSWLSFTDKATNADLDRIAKERATEAQGNLDRLVEAVPGTRQVTTHLLNGSPGSTVPQLAKEINTDLLVLGTAGRTGLSGFFMGNTSEEIIERVNCAVLALKPPGYDTPVRVRKA